MEAVSKSKSIGPIDFLFFIVVVVFFFFAFFFFSCILTSNNLTAHHNFFTWSLLLLLLSLFCSIVSHRSVSLHRCNSSHHIYDYLQSQRRPTSIHSLSLGYTVLGWPLFIVWSLLPTFCMGPIFSSFSRWMNRWTESTWHDKNTVGLSRQVQGENFEHEGHGPVRSGVFWCRWRDQSISSSSIHRQQSALWGYLHCSLSSESNLFIANSDKKFLRSSRTPIPCIPCVSCLLFIASLGHDDLQMISSPSWRVLHRRNWLSTRNTWRRHCGSWPFFGTRRRVPSASW